ncbi:MAG: cation-translocating P-type ATPase [Clostridia bacterium]|nr:cation-translocating P-type ATPase [Clostridia bacterium]
MDFHACPISSVRQEMQSGESGLTEAAARQRLNEHGENRLKEKKKAGVLVRFLRQFKDFMVLTLLAAAVISFFTSRAQGETDYLEPVIILAIVVLNAVVGVVQESRAEHEIEKLRRLSAQEATVLRGGKTKKIPAAQLVPGDVLLLSTGDCVPADGRLIESVALSMQESALTGEALPCEKDAAALLKADTPLAERKNMVYAPAVVLTGHGKAVVTQTGMNTELGRIADMLGSQQAPQTPLQLRLERVGRILGLGALGICALVFGLGLLRHDSLLRSFMLAVGLAVAAIPEGLPAVVTIVLSSGVGRMAKNHAIVRRLPAVEALGSATYICSDKTGTLTQNRMTVRRLADAAGDVTPDSEAGRELLRFAALCTNAVLTAHTPPKAEGEPTENALIIAAAKQKIFRDELDKEYRRVREQPFSSETKTMTVTLRRGNQTLTVCKGAPEAVAALCGEAGDWLSRNDRLAAEGLRVLAVAVSQGDRPLRMLGLIGMEDPERPQVKAAVAECEQAGVTPVMITGDNPRTACAIARRIGILKQNGEVLSGRELDGMSEEELREKTETVRVYARVKPEHKVRIVNALRAKGHVVAMTGDGVNYAPALKAADIGCAMGKSGTQVAKSAADLVLTDDNFATIVRAVREGRGIYDNIKKVVHFLLSSNIGELLLVLAAGLMNLPSPLLPIQLLWVNLVTDSLPAMALGVEKIEPDVMRRKPVDPKTNFFGAGAWLDIALQGMFIGAVSLVAFVLGRGLYGEAVARTMCFCTLSIAELCHALNSRSPHSLFRIGWFSNRKMNLAFIICLVLQLSVPLVPMLSAVFAACSLTAEQWLTVGALSASVVAFVELSKLFQSNLTEKKERAIIKHPSLRREEN